MATDVVSGALLGRRRDVLARCCQTDPEPEPLEEQYFIKYAYFSRIFKSNTRIFRVFFYKIFVKYTYFSRIFYKIPVKYTYF